MHCKKFKNLQKSWNFNQKFHRASFRSSIFLSAHLEPLLIHLEKILHHPPSDESKPCVDQNLRSSLEASLLRGCIKMILPNVVNGSFLHFRTSLTTNSSGFASHTSITSRGKNKNKKNLSVFVTITLTLRRHLVAQSGERWLLCWQRWHQTNKQRASREAVQAWAMCEDYIPKTVRAGTDSLFIQKDTWERITVIMQGIYVWIMK